MHLLNNLFYVYLIFFYQNPKCPNEQMLWEKSGFKKVCTFCQQNLSLKMPPLTNFFLSSKLKQESFFLSFLVPSQAAALVSKPFSLQVNKKKKLIPFSHGKQKMHGSRTCKSMYPTRAQRLAGPGPIEFAVGCDETKVQTGKSMCKKIKQSHLLSHAVTVRWVQGLSLILTCR